MENALFGALFNFGLGVLGMVLLVGTIVAVTILLVRLRDSKQQATKDGAAPDSPERPFDSPERPLD